MMVMTMMEHALLLLSCVFGGAIQVVPLQMAPSKGGGSGHVDDGDDGDWAGMIVLWGCWLLDVDVDSMLLLVVISVEVGDAVDGVGVCDGVDVQVVQLVFKSTPQIVTLVQQNTPGSTPK